MMCGIFGHTNFIKQNLDQSRTALHTLTHRGPDQWNDWFDNNIYIGHRRLSILDLTENGRQPMTNSEQTTVISTNGEIYNYKKLKRKLEKKYQFKSQSDSEVILYGYQAWGIKGLLNNIDGMYAFIIYDAIEKKVFLVRDRVGIKPIYYAYINNSFIWSSELKAIELYVGKNHLITDSTAIYDFITYLYIPTPKTLYKNVNKLEPAHYIEFDLTTNKFNKQCYWELKPQKQEITIDKAATKIKELIKDSVQEQLMSDVPLGFFLSGGMDSSIVVCEAAKCSTKINTYSIGFDIESHNETYYANQVAEYFQTNHVSRILDKTKGKELFNRLKQWFDEPFADTSALPTYLVSSIAKESSTVVLTGDGGDELFGGYRWYFKYKVIYYKRLSKIFSFFRPLFSRIKKRYKGEYFGRIASRIESLLLLDDVELYAKVRGRVLKDEKKTYSKILNIPDDYDDYWYYRKYYRKDLPLLTRLRYMDFHTYLPDQILTKVDRTSMSISLEARVPLLSKKIVEFIFNIPEDILFYNNQLKGLLKYSYRKDLPEEIIMREKKGFSIPLEQWDNLSINDNAFRQKLILNKFFNINLS